MKEIVVKVSSGRSDRTQLLLRQTQKLSGIWKNCKFIVNKPTDKCDWWFVLHGSGLIKSEATYCDPEHIVYVSMEPSEKVSKASQEFLEQFSQIVICDRNIKHPNIKYANWLTWWVGIVVEKVRNKHCFSPKYNFDYNFLSSFSLPKKKNRISVVLSNKEHFEGHKKRLIFLEKILDSPIAKYIDVFGHGFNPIPDKWDAIVSYKYHLVLENATEKDYWSEKLADTFLGYAYPIYYGCPNIFDYFSENALVTIDINRADESIDLLESTIKSDLYDRRIEAIGTARDQILNQYNIFNLMADLSVNKASLLEKIELQPNTFYTDNTIKKIARWFLSLYEK